VLDNIAVMERLHISQRTLYNWVKKGILQPDINSHQDGLRFTESHIAAIEQKRTNYVTLPEAAQLIGVPYPYFLKWVQLNQVQLMPNPFSERASNVIERKLVLELTSQVQEQYQNVKKQTTPKGNRLSIYDNGLRLFDLQNVQNKDIVVVDVNPPLFLFEDGELRKGGIHWVSEPPISVPYKASKGSTYFSFPKQFNRTRYDLLNRLVVQCGLKNIQVFEQEQSYEVICRNGIHMPLSDLPMIQSHLVHGEIYEYEGQIIIGDAIKRIAVPVYQSWLPQLEKQAKQRGYHSVQEYVHAIISKEIDINP
jgi:DNA-binding transcriptional MerR regulator